MKKVTNFKGVEDLHYFLINVLNLILFRDYYYCFCKHKADKKEKGIPIAVYRYFLVTWKNLDINMENVDFSTAYHAKFFPYLFEIFDQDKTATECFCKWWAYLFWPGLEYWRKMVRGPERIDWIYLILCIINVLLM